MIDLSIVSTNLSVLSDFLVLDHTMGSVHLPIITLINTEIDRDDIKETWRLLNNLSPVIN
jgi:hypothetical protein